MRLTTTNEKKEAMDLKDIKEGLCRKGLDGGKGRLKLYIIISNPKKLKIFLKILLDGGICKILC